MTTAGYQRVANHEAAHAAAAAVLDVVPTRVQVGGFPDATAGRVSFEHVDVDRSVARRYAQIMLAGWIGNDEDPPRWPLDAQAPKGSDERKLVTLASYLDLDRASYAALVSETWRLAASPEFRAAECAFRTALGRTHILDRDQIVRLLRVTGLGKHLRGGGAMKGVPLIEVIDRDGRPMRVRADWVPWWEEDEDLAAGTAKAFDDAKGQVATRNGKGHGPIQIKSFEV
jgi:hypothetical protein